MTVKEKIDFITAVKADCKPHKDKALIRICDIALEMSNYRLPKKCDKETIHKITAMNNEYDTQLNLYCPNCGDIVGSGEWNPVTAFVPNADRLLIGAVKNDNS